MPAPVFSERLVVSTLSANNWQYFTVPAASRAVVRCVIAVATTTGGTVYVSVGSGYAVVAEVPGPNQTRLFDLRAVAYAGETIGCMRTDNNVGLSVHGYLFADPGGRGARPLETEAGDPPAFGTALPA